jgi:hypothetical protein
MHDEHCQPCGKYISWQAILGGSLVALGLTFLFNLLTIAIGLSLFTQNTTGKMALTFGGFAWILIGIYIILFLSGWVTGRIVNHRHSLHGANGFLHGFLTWTLYLIISLFALSHMASDSAAALLKTTAVNTEIDSNESVQAGTENTGDSSSVKAQSAQETKSVHKRGITTFSTFFIFLVGAIGCCVGAGYGIRESRKCHEQCTVKKPFQNP